MIGVSNADKDPLGDTPYSYSISTHSSVLYA